MSETITNGADPATQEDGTVAAATTDPIVVDAYENDLDGSPDWATLAASGLPWAGAIIKCTEGTYYAPGWFLTNWRQLATFASSMADRWGRSWFRGAYLYWQRSSNPVAQGELYLSMIEAAGGWLPGDLWPIIDVEHGNNDGVTKAEVEDEVTQLAYWLAQRTGRKPMLYGGSLLRDLGITSHLGCGMLWTAAYGATLPASYYTSIGWSRETLWGWQYRGTSGNTAVPAGYPTTSPIGRLDLTAMVIDDAKGPTAPLVWTQAHTGSLII